MHCHTVNQLLVDYIDGELDKVTYIELEEHLKDCAPCKKFIDTYKVTIKITKKIEPAQMPIELKERLQSFIKEKVLKQSNL